MKKTFTTSLILLALVSFSASAQVVHIPDPNFKNALVSNPAINTNHDTEIQVSEARAVRTLNVSGKSITDLTGIREFTGLTELRIQNNQLSTVDLQGLGNLKLLHCFDNQLTSLNIATNNKLAYLDCRRNSLASLSFGTNTSMYKLNCEHNNIVSIDVTRQPDLSEFIINHNMLTELNVTRNTRLSSLLCGNNLLYMLDVSHNRLLTSLHVYNNQLWDLDVRNNTLLSVLRCNHNELRYLDVSANVALTDLRCYVNKLGTLILGSNNNLTSIMSFNNELTNLDVTGLPALKTLQTQFNLITVLDLKENHALTALDVRKNRLGTLDIRNGANRNITAFNATFNSSLTCISVDDPAYSYANWPNHDYSTNYKTACDPDDAIVYIPDPSFRNWLVTNYEINTNYDGVIQVREAEAYSGSINVPNYNIADLTGIQAFINITDLNCSGNRLSASLDLRNNTKLLSINCSENQIPDMNITGLNVLKYLIIFSNRISGIDLGTNTGLESLAGDNNQLYSLDVSSNHALKEISARNNRIQVLRLVPSLTFLDIHTNNVTHIDLTEAPNIGIINLNDNNLRWINTEVMTELFNAEMAGNQFTDLDFSHSPRLEVLNVRNNRLHTLNMSNIDVANFNSFAAENNPNLHCIQVDDPETAGFTMGYGIDPHMYFSADCGYDDVVYIPDPAFKAKLLELSDLNRNADGEIQYTEARNFTIPLFLVNDGIKDMTGIEAFISLPELNINVNEIKHLDVSTVPLVTLHCAVNQLETLIVGTNSKLTHLTADNNRLQTLDLSGLSRLHEARLSHNRLTSLQVSSPGLMTLDISYNEFESYDPSWRPGMNLLIQHNRLTSLVLAPGGMNILNCSDNLIVSLDVSHMGNLSNLDASNNNLTSLDISGPPLRTFQGIGNPELSCIEVNDVAYAEANWRDNVDPGVQFSTECEAPAARVAPNQTESSGKLAVWPNPSGGKFNIDSSEEVGAVRILDVSGELMTESVGREVDISDFQSGTYYMKVQQGTKVSVVRIVKE